MAEDRHGAGAVRAEDAFDVARVDAWLKGRLGRLGRLAGLDGDPVVTQFSGGASNLTYLLRYPGAELILRRPPAGRKASSAHDMAREYRVQKQLKRLAVAYLEHRCRAAISRV